MDKHHAHVVAAAEAVRAWVIAQRAAAAHADEIVDDRPSLHTVASQPPVPASRPSATSTARLELIAHAHPSPIAGDQNDDDLLIDDDLADDLIDDGVAALVASPNLPNISIAGHPATESVSAASAGFQRAGLRERLRPIASLAHPAFRWGWRVALVTGAVAGVVWTAREYQTRRATQPAAAAVAPAAAPAPLRTIDKDNEKEKVESKPLQAEPPVRTDGRLQIDSDPPGAQIIVDGRDRGKAPVAVDGMPPGSHTVVFKSEKGTVQRMVTVAAGRTTQVNEGIYSGWLHVSSPFALQVAADGRPLRLDDNHQVMLPPGSHTITLANRGLGFQATRAVEITPGGTSSIDIELPSAMLTVTTSEPAQVSVDGDIVGNAPLTDHAAGIGVRDITARSTTGQVRHVTVTLPTEGARVDIDFTKP